MRHCSLTGCLLARTTARDLASVHGHQKLA